MKSHKNDNIKVFTLKNPRHMIVTGFGSGLSPFFPGTIGSLAAIPLWILLHFLPFPGYLFSLIVAFTLGVYLCDITERETGINDHGSIVWDEFVGMGITFIALPVFNGYWILVAFILFRLFDIWKPWPIRWVDKNCHGGIGIMIDDVIAGVISAFCLWGIGLFFA